LGTTAILPDKKTTQVIDNKGMGDTGFEPVTSTVCKLLKFKRKYSVSYCFCFHWLTWKPFFLWFPILTDYGLFFPQNSHSLSHSLGDYSSHEI
jgi:hypothetical protein